MKKIMFSFLIVFGLTTNLMAFESKRQSDKARVSLGHACGGIFISAAGIVTGSLPIIFVGLSIASVALDVCSSEIAMRQKKLAALEKELADREKLQKEEIERLAAQYQNRLC